MKTTALLHLTLSVRGVSGRYDPPRHFARMSLLKSVHIFGKHKVQYEIRTMFRVVELLRLTGSTADTFLEYSQRMLPEGIAMKVTRVSAAARGHGGEERGGGDRQGKKRWF